MTQATETSNATSRWDYVSYRVEDHIAYIELCRPDKHNAITDQVGIELYQAFEQFDYDKDAHVAILSGQGKSFSTGADVYQRQMRPQDELEKFGPQSPDSRWLDMFQQCHNWKPVIAAVHGYCLGMAVAIALRCEIVVATPTSKWQVTETARGLNGSGVWAVMNFRGGGVFADEVSLTGRYFSGQEAFDHGLVHTLAADDELLATARGYAEAMLTNPPLALRVVTRVRRWHANENDRMAKLMYETRPILYKSQDFKEAVTAFAERRQPGPWLGE